jgi:hypothetical protein
MAFLPCISGGVKLASTPRDRQKCIETGNCEEMKLTRNNHIVDFETFSKILNRPGGFRDPGEPEEYCRGFQVFDKDMTGFIGVGQLRYILTNLGEKMSDEEVDELLKAVDTSSGEINYTGMFTDACYGPVKAGCGNSNANEAMRRSCEDSIGELDKRVMGIGRVA